MIEEQALADALDAGRLAGAGLRHFDRRTSPACKSFAPGAIVSSPRTFPGPRVRLVNGCLRWRPIMSALFAQAPGERSQRSLVSGLLQRAGEAHPEFPSAVDHHRFAIACVDSITRMLPIAWAGWRPSRSPLWGWNLAPLLHHRVELVAYDPAVCPAGEQDDAAGLNRRNAQRPASAAMVLVILATARSITRAVASPRGV